MPSYDYIFLGTGAAGLSLLMRMIDSGKFSEKKILLVDRDQKISNDRTWCFWEKGQGYFESLVYKTWDHLSFKSDDFSSRLETGDYRYKMIRSIDFYNYCFEKIAQQSNIELKYGEVTAGYNFKEGVAIYIDKELLVLDHGTIFNSIYFKPPKRLNDIHLLQHFKGWTIETAEPVFNKDEAVLMDFRIDQNHRTSFIYVLPFTPNKALVEYTLFTEIPLAPEDYDKVLKDYILRYLKIPQFNMLEEENGTIPMTTADFPFFRNGVYHIGTAGGQTKASTGYTFSFIQKQSELIVQSLIKGEKLTNINGANKRFKFYDRVLLQALINGKPGGKEIFTRLFERNKADSIFKFLDNESSIGEELALIKTLHTVPFLKAALQQVL